MLLYCVEDDDNIRELIVYFLANSGYEAVGFAEGKSFLEALEKKAPALILLDIMLPGQDGISLLKTIRSRKKTAEIPVILLTAKSTELDKVIGLDTGADDYITKPFGMMELHSRIKAVLRRARREGAFPSLGEISLLSHKGIEVNQKTHTVTVDGKEIILTLKEFELLVYLLQNRGFVLTREQILSAVWDYETEVQTRTVDVHIQTLRQKLGDRGSEISTVRGVGYRMEA